MAVAGTSAKAKDFAAYAKEAGWTAKVKTEGDIIEVMAKRGDETICLHWGPTAFIDDAYYECGGYRVKMRNANAARLKMKEPADKSVSEANRLASGVKKGPRKAARRPDPEDIPRMKARLPFDPDKSTDEEVIAALLGRTIYYHHPHSDTEQSERIRKEPDQRHLRIEQKGLRRILHCVVERGHFMAIYLDRIERVK